MSNNTLRIITALVGFICIAAAYIFLDHLGVILVTLVISLGAYYEFLRLPLLGNNPKEFKLLPTCLALLSAVILLLWFSSWFDLRLKMLPGIAILLLLLSTVVNANFVQNQEALFKRLLLQFFGLFYVVHLLSYIPLLHKMPNGPLWLVCLIGVNWVGDTFAYYGGSLMGRNKLAPKLSPNKSIEGSLCAIIGSVCFFLIMQHYFLTRTPILAMILLAAATSVVGQMGDLFESMLKRVAQVKDSGRLLPGHGGMLDRLDSLILSAPFFYFCLQFFADFLSI